MDTHRSRLAWRCRRGTKELDILLQRFFQQEFDGMPPAEQECFESLLEVQDPEISDWIWGRRPLPNGLMGQLIERIRTTSPDPL